MGFGIEKREKKQSRPFRYIYIYSRIGKSRSEDRRQGARAHLGALPVQLQRGQRGQRPVGGGVVVARQARGGQRARAARAGARAAPQRRRQPQPAAALRARAQARARRVLRTPLCQSRHGPSLPFPRLLSSSHGHNRLNVSTHDLFIFLIRR